MFNYLYYRIYATYKYRWKDNMPWIYALGVLSIIQYFYCMVLYMIYFSFKEVYISIEIWYGGVGVAILLFINYIYFNKITNFEKLEAKWKDENKTWRRIKGIIIVIFLMISFISFIFLSDYIGDLNRNFKP